MGPSRKHSAKILKASVLYLLVSSATLPFLFTLWLSELPIFAVIQLPKVFAAKWVRDLIVFHLLDGPVSPARTLARPYGLAVVYLLSVIGLLAMGGFCKRREHPYGVWSGILIAAATIDYILSLMLLRQGATVLY